MTDPDAPRTLLDAAMPRWHFREHHTRPVPARRGEAVLAALPEVTWSEVPVFAGLLRVGSLGKLRRDPARPVLEDMRASGFRVLARTDDEFVMVAVSGGEEFPAEDDTPGPMEWFRTYAPPGSTKVAFNARVRGGVLSTETRVFAADEPARRAFRAYWMLVRLPGGLVRRELLRAMGRRAGRAGQGPSAPPPTGGRGSGQR
ncbi:hypothetical protein [Streptomyces palmae]|uniref:DUF2867 domain-containing protein n=1 Tax=Streptomyces palmae TaxID=1701085 RepID=A0A4Z0H6S0_9ACTN|nr:hypothetical protein [Streptomyces palmae]TGB08736.1 hypothetical protein E4099_14905 [Streptomyces palmae]